jgi:hypothetical protein
MFRWSSYYQSLTVATLALLGPAPAPAQPFIVRSGSGATPADILGVVNQFRADLGGGTVAGPNGLFSDATGARREITWDDVPASVATPNDLPVNYFNTTSPRGVGFLTSGSNRFQVSGAPTDTGTPGQPAAANFGNINPTYQTQFQPFSSPRLFTPLQSNATGVSLFVPGTSTPATIRGFGAVFTDVDRADAAVITLFGPAGELATFPVPPSPSGGLSFLGAFTNAGAPISFVVIRSGSFGAALGPFVNDVSNFGTADLVVMDDFIYGEPIAVPEPSSLALLGVGASCFAAWRRWRPWASGQAAARDADNPERS